MTHKLVKESPLHLCSGESYEMNDNYEEYLIDEAKYQGQAESISFPQNEDVMLEIIASMREAGVPITIQGGKTGIVGASVPPGGHIMNLSHMNHSRGYQLCQDGTAYITVEPGMNLIDLKKEISRIKSNTAFFWPPDPTETSATIGGIAASNAKGPGQLLYGDTKKYIFGLKMITSDGKILIYNRVSDSVKMDNLLGKEGITGAFCELTLKLFPKPEEVWGIAFFFESDEDVGGFISKLKAECPQSQYAETAAVEYIDRTSIDLIQARKSFMTKVKELPDVEPQFTHMIYLELLGTNEGIEELAERLMELAINHNADPDKAWAVSGEVEVEKLKAFRHAAAEATNLYIEEVRREDKRITKLGTDMTLQGNDFLGVLKQTQKDMAIAGLHYCMFGHVCDNHLHINILPNNYEEYKTGLLVIDSWAKQAFESKGRIVSEHGIGKLKKSLYAKYGDAGYLEECKRAKLEFDPGGLWNPGNILD